jgi:hypothetical protein
MGRRKLIGEVPRRSRASSLHAKQLAMERSPTFVFAISRRTDVTVSVFVRRQKAVRLELPP